MKPLFVQCLTRLGINVLTDFAPQFLVAGDEVTCMLTLYSPLKITWPLDFPLLNAIIISLGIIRVPG